MSVIGGGEQRPVALLYAGAAFVPLILGILLFAILVAREHVQTKAYRDKAKKLDDEIAKADEYLRRHQNDKLERQFVDDVAAEVKRRIPYGPVDLDVVEYIQGEAVKSNIVDLKADVVGGIKVPRAKDEDTRTATQRLVIDPTRLQSTTIDITFASRYRDALLFLRSLSQGPWPMEIVSLNMERQVPGPKIAVKVDVRYLYE
jgi:hypothetical protein